MRAAMLFAALVCSAAPGLAQSHDHGKLPEVTGGGKFPAGWQARRDDKAAGAELDNVKLVAMGSGLHATVGRTNAVLWNPVNHIVNGQVVHQQKRDYLKPAGVVGLRVNMYQDMHVANFSVKSLAR
ncbi:MAG: hypothetical protein WEE89_02920 [Gemmatimonadota bacterium]